MTKPDKLKMHSPDLTQENIAKIRELFPNCVTEALDEKTGKLTLKVDFDLLRQELSNELVEGPVERYRLDWPGKRASLLAANAPIAKTLRPCREESVDFDTTQNLFIEGDNLEALKLLQEAYLGKVKMIYIDPPYNTGDDFVYSDNFSERTEEYFRKSTQKDEYGGKLVENLESNGRFHSNWLGMMYSRLKVCASLLRNDGVIFVSISDREVSNLKKIMDDIFGEKNFIGIIEWNSTKSVTNTAIISVNHTHNVVYAKSKDYFVKNRIHFRLPESGEGFDNPDKDPRGPWKADPFQVEGVRPNQQYEIVNPNTGKIYKPNPGCSWKNDYKKFKELLSDNRIVFGASGEAGPQRKRFLFEARDRGRVAKSWWDEVDTTSNATSNLKKFFSEKKLFTNPKPVSLLKKMILLGDHTRNGIILDFFAGSATTAHAVMQLNAEDGGNRRFIMVQLPEPTPEKSEARKAGFETIADIAKERIRRAGKKILEGECHPDWNRDVGFRVLKVDTSNMKDVYYFPDELKQEDLEDLADNVKSNRTAEDLLFQVLIDWGVEPTLPIRRETIQGKEVFFVDENALIACFDTYITEDLVKELARHKPLRVVFRDAGFESDAVRINTAQIFRQLSPETDVKVI